MKHLHQLRESVASRPSKVDWANGVIYGVKVLAETSRNGFVYPRETRVKAHKLLENLRVNIDHLAKHKKGEDVPFAARFGKLVNVREGAGGTFADLKFNVKHKLAESIAYAAEHLDDTLGMSINGTGHGTKTDAQGRKIVDEIARLRSCDVVADPGSTHSLFESENMETELATEVAAALTGTTDEAEQLTALEALIAKRKAPAEVVESADEATELARLKTEKECLVLCESLKVPVTTELLDTLADLPTEDKRKKLLAQIKKPAPVQPRSAAVPLRESAPADPVAERKRLANLLRARN